jgi:hypothetical protein
MKRHRASRPGPKPAIVKLTEPIENEQSILMAIILLRRGKSAALVAIDKNVRLPIARVRQFESLLKQAGLLGQHDSDG